MFGVARNGVAKAYPQHVLSWHEIVNDTIGGDPVAVTNCPLTGTVRGFERGDVEFGVSGRIVTSNLIMYDRATDSRWPQMYATAVDSPLTGEALRGFRLVWAQWADWRVIHPVTHVLTAETGYERRYHDDQYGGYNPRQGSDDYGGQIHEALVENDPEATGLADKMVVLGARPPDGAVAFREERLLAERVLAVTGDGLDVVAVADPRVEAGYAYANPDGIEVRPVADEAAYEIHGGAYSPTKLPLDRLAAFDAMWFAWLACYPDTERVA